MNDDLVRRDFITAYQKRWNTTEEYADGMMEHVETGAKEDALRPLYKKLCDMHMEMLLLHGPQVAQGIAAAVKEVHDLLPDESAATEEP